MQAEMDRRAAQETLRKAREAGLTSLPAVWEEDWLRQVLVECRQKIDAET